MTLGSEHRDEWTRPRGSDRRRRRSRRPSPGRIVGVSLLALTALLLTCGAWIGIRGYVAVTELQEARALIDDLQAEVGTADTETLTARSDALIDKLSAARSMTADPVWRVAELIPVAGANFTALRETTATLGAVGDDVIGPLVELAGALKVAEDAAEPGVLPLAPLVDAAPALERAAVTATAGAAQMDAIDTTRVVGPLEDAVDEVRPLLHTAADGLQTAGTLSQVVPSMLGADGPRLQLATFLNNAEVRSSGGIVGALAEITADGGRVSLGRQSAASAMNAYREAPIELTVDQVGIFGAESGTYMQNATAYPEFATTGRLASEMWSRQFGVRPDGVIAVDPVALGYLLEATGPVVLATGDELRADNVVDVLLRDVYARYPNPADQDAFFAAAAGQVFQALADGDADPLLMLEALTKAAGEGRLRLWSGVPEEQALLEQTVLAPGLPKSVGTTEQFAVYYNDATGAKMDYYLDSTISVRQEQCTPDGLPIYDIDIAVTNNAPADAAQSLSAYVTGGGFFGVEPGRIRTDIAVYGPEGSVFESATRDGAPLPLQSALDGDHFVAQFRTEIAPGENSLTSVRFIRTVPAVEDTGVQFTPLIRPIALSQLTAGC